MKLCPLCCSGERKYFRLLWVGAIIDLLYCSAVYSQGTFLTLRKGRRYRSYSFNFSQICLRVVISLLSLSATPTWWQRSSQISSILTARNIRRWIFSLSWLEYYIIQRNLHPYVKHCWDSTCSLRIFVCLTGVWFYCKCFLNKAIKQNNFSCRTVYQNFSMVYNDGESIDSVIHGKSPACFCITRMIIL